MPHCLPTRTAAACMTHDPRCMPFPYGEGGEGNGEYGAGTEYGGYEGAESADASGYPGYGWGDESGNY